MWYDFNSIVSSIDPDTERPTDAHSYILIEQTQNVNTYLPKFCENYNIYDDKGKDMYHVGLL